MTTSSGPRPNTSATPDTKATSEAVLIANAKRCIGDALDAWAQGDQFNVALKAPVAVELLGKAALWRENPVLLVQLADQHEASLFLLAIQPDLTDKDVRTIGLQVVMNRLTKLIGDLPLPQKRQKRIAEVRNGAVHVGSAGDLRHVLLDCLAILQVLLDRLGIERKDFLGLHLGTVDALLDERKTEISRQVAVKLAMARARLTSLEEALGEEAFRTATDELENQRWTVDPDDFGLGGDAIDANCPECGSKARLFGELDAQGGGGGYDEEPQDWRLWFSPWVFYCMVCHLQLHGSQELVEAGLPSRHFEIESDDVGPDFDVEAFADAKYSWRD
jgi:hypothetical protein